MARFRGTLKGARGQASRLGSGKSGLAVEANGWKVGVSVYAHENNVDGSDLFDIYLSGGSNGSDIRAIGFVRLRNGVPTFELAESLKAVNA